MEDDQGTFKVIPMPVTNEESINSSIKSMDDSMLVPHIVNFIRDISRNKFENGKTSQLHARLLLAALDDDSRKKGLEFHEELIPGFKEDLREIANPKTAPIKEDKGLEEIIVYSHDESSSSEKEKSQEVEKSKDDEMSQGSEKEGCGCEGCSCTIL
jgi:hypothetical protein